MKRLLLYFQLFIIFSSSLFAQDISSGVKLIRDEKYAQAKNTFNSLLNGESKAEAYFYLGEIYFFQSKIDSAKQFYEKGIAADKELALNYAGLVRVNLFQKNSAEAEKNYNQALELGEDIPQVYIVLAEAYSSEYGGKNYDKSINLLNEALKINPQSVKAYVVLGNVYLANGNGSEAIKNFQRAIDIDGTNPEPMTRKAKVYILIGNYEQANILLSEAIKIDPSYSPAYSEIAELNATTKNYLNAAEYYSQHIEASEITLEKQKRFASILYMNKEYEKTINILKDVISKEPDNASSIRILAYSYLRLDDIENSKSYFQKLFEIPSVDYLPTDYENYADLLSKTGNDSLAIDYLYKIVELDSLRKDVYGDISILYFKNKKWNGVISALESKGELTAQEYFDLGKAYYFIQDYTKADSAFNLLSAKVPDLAIAYFWRARVQTNFDPESEQGLAKPYYEQFLSVSGEDTTKFKKELIEAYSYLGYYFYLKEDPRSKEYWLKVEAIDPENQQAKAALKEL
jgi:tetratricopeptide (TPR) repeat protein